MVLGKINHIEFFVDDLKKAEEYFTKKLGFKVVRRTEHAGKAIELVAPAGEGIIFELHPRKVGAQRKDKDPLGWPAFNHVAFEVDDINKEFEELKSKGIKFMQDAPSFNPLTGRTLADTYDADGRMWIQLQDKEK